MRPLNKKKKSKHILYYRNTGNLLGIGDESCTNRKTNDGILNTHSTRENNFARNHILKNTITQQCERGVNFTT